MNEHEINRNAARPQDFDAKTAVEKFNAKKKGARDLAREAVENRPQIDLLERAIPADVIDPFDGYNLGFSDGYKARDEEDADAVNTLIGGVKL